MDEPLSRARWMRIPRGIALLAPAGEARPGLTTIILVLFMGAYALLPGALDSVAAIRARKTLLDVSLPLAFGIRLRLLSSTMSAAGLGPIKRVSAAHT